MATLKKFSQEPNLAGAQTAATILTGIAVPNVQSYYSTVADFAATATAPGFVNNTTQSMSGAKTFTTSIAAGNLTSGRIALVGTAGLIQDDAAITYATGADALIDVATSSASANTPHGYTTHQYSTDTVGSGIFALKARGTSGAPLIVASGDTMLQLSALGLNNAATYAFASQVTFTVDGTPGARVPGAINFITDNNTASGTRWTIQATGNLIAGTDDTYSIGAAGATRPSSGFFGTSVAIGTAGTKTGTLTLAPAGSAFTTSFQSGALPASRTYVFPAADPTNGQAVTASISGSTITLSYATFPTFSSGLLGRMAVWSSTSAITAEPNTIYADQMAGADWGAKITAAIALLSASGGTVDATGLTGAQSLSGTLTIATPNVTIRCGAMLLSMGSNQIAITGGTNHVRIEGFNSWGGPDPSSGNQGGSQFSYTGAASAFALGDSTATSYFIVVKNIGLDISGANATTGKGFNFTRVTIGELNNCRVKMSATGGSTQHGISLNGNSSPSDTASIINIYNPYVTNSDGIGIYFGFQANGNNVYGGNVNGAATGFGATFDNGANGNHIFGTDFEGYNVAWNFLAGAVNNILDVRQEGGAGTATATFASGANGNCVRSDATFGISDAGSFNTSWYPLAIQFDVSGRIFSRPRTGSGPNVVWGARPGNGSAADFYIEGQDSGGTARWRLYLENGGTNTFRVSDVANSKDRILFAAGSNSDFNSVSTGAIRFNLTNTSGTGGLLIGDGAASAAQVWGVTSAGVVTMGRVSAVTGQLSLANASSANLTTLQAGNATAAVTYTLPTAAPTVSGQVLSSTTAGVTSWITATVSPFVVSAQATGPVTVSTGATGTYYTNTGASGSVTFNLPAATGSGVHYWFLRDANQSVVIDPNGTDLLQIGASVTTNGGTLTEDAVGTLVHIVDSVSGKWYGMIAGNATFS